MSINIIVAIANDNAIGRHGDLAFHISADLKRFKAITMGHTVVMGRKTFESLPGGALPGRRNIVITRNPLWAAPGAEAFNSLEEALKASVGEVFIIGGGEIYAQALPIADSLMVTRIYADAQDADTFFPIYQDQWEISEQQEMATDPKSGVEYRFQTLLRKKV